MHNIDEIREAVNKLFSAISSSPAVMMLGSEATEAAWELDALINPKEDDGGDKAAKIKNQAENPHDHQDYCEGCQSNTDMDIDDITRCGVCYEKYPNGY